MSFGTIFMYIYLLYGYHVQINWFSLHNCHAKGYLYSEYDEWLLLSDRLTIWLLLIYKRSGIPPVHIVVYLPRVLWVLCTEYSRLVSVREAKLNT